MMDEYIIQVRNRQVGNSALWWAKNSKGFTTDPYEAEIYTKERASSYEISCDVIAWERSTVLHLSEHHTDIGKLVGKRYE